MSFLRGDNTFMVAVKRKDFEALDDRSLIWTCIEPTIQKVRGKNFTIKSEVYSQLNDGQKALLMFQILYGHTLHGVEEFFCHLSYLLSNKGMWPQLKNGMLYFGAHDMVLLLDEMNNTYDNSETEPLGRLDTLLHTVLPATVVLVGSYIRRNPAQFVQFIE